MGLIKNNCSAWLNKLEVYNWFDLSFQDNLALKYKKNYNCKKNT